MADELAHWLNERLRDRGWSIREFGRRAGVSHSHASRVLNGESHASIRMCKRIAKVFNVPPKMVLEMADILPKDAGPGGDFEDLLYYWQQLDESEQRIVLRQIIGLVAHDTKETIRERVASIVHRADVSVLPVGASVLPVMPDLVQSDEDASPASDLDGLPTGAKAGA